MYDVDGNGVIDLEEMTKIVQAIYDMLGAGAVKPTYTAEERAKNIFNRLVHIFGNWILLYIFSQKSPLFLFPRSKNKN